MPTIPKRGMDHDLYRYSPMPERPALGWPDGQPLALMVILHFEYWELDPPAEAYHDRRYGGEFGAYTPEYRIYSTREYGNRIGVFRLLDVLDRHGIPATIAANAEACRRYPNLVEEFARRGFEFAAHGTHASRMITSKMTEAEERAHIGESIEAVEQATGSKPTGWIGQDFGETPRTFGLLAEAGLDYVGDWPNDDQPYPAEVGTPPLISLPYHVEFDDAFMLWVRRIATARYPVHVAEAADCLIAEGRTSARMLSLGIRPWLFGQAHRIRYLDEALAGLAGRAEVWRATGAEIASAYRAAVNG